MPRPASPASSRRRWRSSTGGSRRASTSRRPTPSSACRRAPSTSPRGLQEWPRDGGPRRAGVSSFGIGGTNAHVVLEEAPREQVAERGAAAAARGAQLLLLSAKTAAALEAATDRLAEHLETHADLDLADVAHTLRVGRRAFAHRRAVVCASREEAVAALRARDAERVSTHALPVDSRRRRARSPSSSPARAPSTPAWAPRSTPRSRSYREALDRCCALFVPALGRDLRELLHATGDDDRRRTRRCSPPSWRSRRSSPSNGRSPRSGGPGECGRRRCSATRSASTWPPAWPASSRWRRRCGWWRRAAG